MYYQSYGYPYQAPYYMNSSPYNYVGTPTYWTYPYGAISINQLNPSPVSGGNNGMMLKDYGETPFVININEASKQNNTYRTALWTGKHLPAHINESGTGRRYWTGDSSECRSIFTDRARARGNSNGQK